MMKRDTVKIRTQASRLSLELGRQAAGPFPTFHVFLWNNLPADADIVEA